MRSKKKRVTIADVARQAGVSPAAVSLTLADRRGVALSEATRSRIKRCAEELGYFHSRLGEGFLRGRSGLIGVLIIIDSYRPFLDCAAGINEGLAEADCFPLFLSPDWMEKHLEVRSGSSESRNHTGGLPDLRRLLEYQVDGILYYSANEPHTSACVRELSGRNIPVVVLAGAEPSVGEVDIVGGDNEATGRMVAEHLLSVGCSSFAFVKPAASHPIDDVIYASFAARLGEAGHACAKFSVDVREPGDPGALLSRLLRPPAGVFCSRDDIAALMLRAGFGLGWRVPRDFAVVGMGDSELSQLNALPLTAVNRNSFEAGKAAAQLLIRRIEGFSEPPQRILAPPALVVRESSVSDVSWLLQPRRDAPPRKSR